MRSSLIVLVFTHLLFLHLSLKLYIQKRLILLYGNYTSLNLALKNPL